MPGRYTVCDFKTGTFFTCVKNGKPDFTPVSYRATQYKSRVEARIKADALNARDAALDCDAITSTAAWAMERIQMREAIINDGAGLGGQGHGRGRVDRGPAGRAGGGGACVPGDRVPACVDAGGER